MWLLIRGYGVISYVTILIVFLLVVRKAMQTCDALQVNSIIACVCVKIEYITCMLCNYDDYHRGIPQYRNEVLIMEACTCGVLVSGMLLQVNET